MKGVPGLRGRAYEALFRSDREPERVEFAVAGRACWVDLLPMDKDARDGFARMAMGEGRLERAPEILCHLVGKTVVDYCLWRRQIRPDGTPGDWEQLRPPEGRKDLVRVMREEFQALPGFWDDLVAECNRVNGFDEDNSGN